MPGPIRICILIALVTAFSGSSRDAYAQAGRGAGQGAAIGGVLGLLLGDDLGDVFEGAAVGAAAGAVSGAISQSNRNRDAERAELDRLRGREMQLLEQERARTTQDERRRLEEERLALTAERMRLEEQLAAARASSGSAPTTPDDEEAWIQAIGEDNYNSAEALVGCQHDRASFLAQAGNTTDNPDYRLASKWIETLIAVDRRDISCRRPAGAPGRRERCSFAVEDRPRDQKIHCFQALFPILVLRPRSPGQPSLRDA